ncbi:helix-turn-helix transcriptional regulator [Vagococcus vulneris]
MLKKWRFELNFTQQEIGDQLNVTRQIILSWECDKSPNLMTVVKISDIYRMSIGDLLSCDTKLLLGAFLLFFCTLSGFSGILFSGFIKLN